jgi:periplasmic protein TonB
VLARAISSPILVATALLLLTAADMATAQRQPPTADERARELYLVQVVARLAGKQFRLQVPSKEIVITLKLRIGKRGELLDAAVISSSGSDSFDREILTVVREAAPFPPPPAELEGPLANWATLVVPLTLRQTE